MNAISTNEDWRIPVYARGAGGGEQRKAPQPATKKRLRALQLGRCLYCQLPIGARVRRNGRTVALTAHWDHFVPFAYLAQNPDANWVLSCQVCNGIKSDRMFQTVGEARAVVLRERQAKGYELTTETVARLKPRKSRRAKRSVKAKPKPKPVARRVPAPRSPTPRVLPAGAVAHGCGAWWTGNRRSHCAGCCQTFATERAAQLHRVGEGSERRCLSPEQVGLVPVLQRWGTCWERPKPSAPI
ncbi:hypothetical protein GCM10010099_23800 [Streptomyces cinereus]|nr:hypothetical protein GCM10010099_23800 [Streptomyces cinereus]